MASEEASPTQKPEEVPIELPAPPGWKKTYNPGKSGTPKRYQIVFTSPSGEEIKSKSQLDKYLKSHPGGPAASEFDWSTGETPRRSSRISSKAKATESPEDEPPRKRSSSKKAAEVEADKTDDEDKNAEEKEAGEVQEESKACEDAKMQDVENVVQMEKVDVSSGELMAGNVPISEEKVEVKPEIPEQQGHASEESTLEQESTLGAGPMSGGKMEVNIEIRKQHGDAFEESPVEEQQKSTLAGEGLIPVENVEVNTQIPEQRRDAFEECTLEKEQISISSLEVPETNESKEADAKPKGPEDFQEAKTSSEAKEGSTVNESMQAAEERVKGAQDRLAENKSQVDIEKSSHKDGEGVTNASAEGHH